MGYRLLADALVVLHLAFVLFVVLGGGLVLWRIRLAILHIPAAVWGTYIELSGRVCPLTPWEVRARLAGGEAGYEGGFIDHYLVPVLYPPGLDRSHQIWLGLLVAGINLGFYGVAIARFRKRGRARVAETDR